MYCTNSRSKLVSAVHSYYYNTNLIILYITAHYYTASPYIQFDVFPILQYLVNSTM